MSKSCLKLLCVTNTTHTRAKRTLAERERVRGGTDIPQLCPADLRDSWDDWSCPQHESEVMLCAPALELAGRWVIRLPHPPFCPLSCPVLWVRQPGKTPGNETPAISGKCWDSFAPFYPFERLLLSRRFKVCACIMLCFILNLILPCWEREMCLIIIVLSSKE